MNSAPVVHWIFSVGSNPASFAGFRRVIYRAFHLVRWRHVDFNSIGRCRGKPHLVILDGDASNPEIESTLKPIKESWPEAHLFYLEPMMPENRSANQKLVDAGFIAVKLPEDFRDKLALPEFQPHSAGLEKPPNDLDYEALVQRLGNNGHEQLSRVVDRFLPGKLVMPEVVVSGWSGDAVLRLQLMGDSPADFYLKLHFNASSNRIAKIIDQSTAARLWLDEATVELHPLAGGLVEGEDYARTLAEVFEGFSDFNDNPYIPVCWRSAGTNRFALGQRYLNAPEGELQQSYESLFAALGRKQGSGNWQSYTPSKDECKRGFFSDAKRDRAGVKAVLNDARRYAQHVPSWPKWRRDFVSVEHFLDHGPKDWVMHPAWVQVGHTHWDPHSRNVMVGDKADELVLIDCGDYRTFGFRVTDLALVEADLKLLLMDSEASDDFGDRDPHKVSGWIEMEKTCIRNGIALTSARVTSYAQVHQASQPVKKAYALIALVRQAANALCQDKDPKGQQYFASLLYRTLNWLTLPALETPKRLLGIYSAARILDQTWAKE